MSPKISFIFLKREKTGFFFFGFLVPSLCSTLALNGLKKMAKADFEPGWFCLVSHFPRKKERKKVFSNFKLRDPLCSVFVVGHSSSRFKKGKWSHWGGIKDIWMGGWDLTKEAF